MTSDVNIPDERDFDIVDIAQLVNDGQSITGQAVLVDLDGTLEYLNFTCRRHDEAAAVFPGAQTSVAAITWLHLHGLADLTTDAKEAMSLQRDWLRDLDVQDGPQMWLFTGVSS